MPELPEAKTISVSGFHSAASVAEFDRMWSLVCEVLDPLSRLPEVPFRSQSGCIAISDEFGLVESTCVPVLHSLSAVHGDHEIVAVSVDPTATDWQDRYGFLPGFTVEPSVSGADFMAAMDFHLPGGAGVSYLSRVLAIAGSSGKWGAWVERDWSDSPMPFAPPLQALKEFACFPKYNTAALGKVDAFVRNVEAYDVVAETD